MQNGGLLVVAAGGEKVLLTFKQKSPGDHVENEVILNALGITSQAVEPVADGDKAETKEGEKDEGQATSQAEGEKEEGKTMSEAEGEKCQAEGKKEDPEEEGCGAPGGGECCR